MPEGFAPQHVYRDRAALNAANRKGRAEAQVDKALAKIEKKEEKYKKDPRNK